MTRYIISWKEETLYRAIIEANSKEEAEEQYMQGNPEIYDNAKIEDGCQIDGTLTVEKLKEDE